MLFELLNSLALERSDLRNDYYVNMFYRLKRVRLSDSVTRLI